MLPKTCYRPEGFFESHSSPWDTVRSISWVFLLLWQIPCWISFFTKISKFALPKIYVWQIHAHAQLFLNKVHWKCFKPLHLTVLSFTALIFFLSLFVCASASATAITYKCAPKSLQILVLGHRANVSKLELFGFELGDLTLDHLILQTLSGFPQLPSAIRSGNPTLHGTLLIQKHDALPSHQ